jgi:hypothetical protein
VAPEQAPPYIRCMDVRRTFAQLSAFAVVCGTLCAAPASAVDILVPGTMTPSAAEVEILKSIRSREAFQLEQRIGREIDRLTVRQPSPRLDVPVVRPTCREDVYGQKMLRSCR